MVVCCITFHTCVVFAGLKSSLQEAKAAVVYSMGCSRAGVVMPENLGVELCKVHAN